MTPGFSQRIYREKQVAVAAITSRELPMIARVLTPDKRTTVEVESDTMVGLFSAVAEVQDIFGSLTCGGCHSVNVRLGVRPGKTKEGKPFKNYEARCRDCGRILRFGQTGDGMHLWAKTKDSDGGRSGWMTWDELTIGQPRDDQSHPDEEDQSQGQPGLGDEQKTPW